MAAMIDRLSCFSQSDQPNRRKAARSPAHATVQVSTASGQTGEAVIGDVSTHGCSVRIEADWLREGRFVAILLESDEELQAIVRWCRDGVAGLEFLRPVPGDRVHWHALINSPWGA